MTTAPLMLNLDDLTADVKKVVLKSATHEAVEMTVEAYLAKVKQAKEIKDTDEGMETRIEQSIQFLHEMFPTIEMTDLRELPLRKLTALITFAMAAPQDLVKQEDAKTPAGNV